VTPYAADTPGTARRSWPLSRNLAISLLHLAGSSEITRTPRPSDATGPACSATCRYEAKLTSGSADPWSKSTGCRTPPTVRMMTPRAPSPAVTAARLARG